MTTLTPITDLNFNETGPITLGAFIEHHNKLSLSSERVQSRPESHEMSGKDMTHYKCVLTNDGRQMTFYYSMGLAHKKAPELEDVLCSLAVDVQTIMNCEGAEDILHEGLADNPKSARAIFNGCTKAREGLKRIFPDTFNILVNHTEV